MMIQLQRDDFCRLIQLVQRLPGFGNVRDRRQRLTHALQGEPRAETLLASLDLDGPPDLAATEVITRLMQFGQFTNGREALGVFLHAVLESLGEGEEAAFIRKLFTSYPLDTPTRTQQIPAGNTTMPNVIKVFVSYSHQDADYLQDNSLLGFLKELERDGVEFWTDRKIRPGELWDTVIKDNLQSASLALVLVSQAFLDSDYCRNVEIERFLAQKTHLIPIILSPCDWRRHRWLSERQFLPGGNETLEEHYTDTGRRKALFLKIREAVRERIELIHQSTPAPASSPQAHLSAAAGLPATRYSGKTQLEFCRRLGDDWRHLATWLEIPSADQTRFERGDEARQLWTWLGNRQRLAELAPALVGIGREDLAELLQKN